jgi:hypothetical protein
MSHFFTTILISFLLMCAVAIPTTIFIFKMKKNFRKPAITCLKFKIREKFQQHGQNHFKDDDR